MNGTVTLPASVTTETYAVYIDNNANGGDGYIWMAGGTISGSAIPYSISEVDAGTYFIYCLVDVDDSGGPTAGDYAGIYGGTIFAPGLGELHRAPDRHGHLQLRRRPRRARSANGPGGPCGPPGSTGKEVPSTKGTAPPPPEWSAPPPARDPASRGPLQAPKIGWSPS